MTPPDSLEVQVVARSNEWIELILPETAYTDYQVANPLLYKIKSNSDSRYIRGLSPQIVHHRHWPENAWYRPEISGQDLDAFQIYVIYRVYLKLPLPLISGSVYTLETNQATGIAGPFQFQYDPAQINDAIHVNQSGYLPKGSKIAYLSWWTGQGSIDFGTSETFDVIEKSTGDNVYSGLIIQTVKGGNELWSRSTIYKLDFSDLESEGTYYLNIPNVGRSHSFEIAANQYHKIGYTVIRGLSMLRDGNHGLNADITQWHRPPAHTDDAIDEATGQRIDLVGGHMDAGDRGHYPHNAAEAACSLLSAMMLFPDEIEYLGETLNLPESDNGVPDLLDETAYELDWLVKAIHNSALDGTLPQYLRPQDEDGDGVFEMGMPLEGASNRKFFTSSRGPNRHDTLLAAGALAMAANTPLMQKYAPDKCQQYTEAALHAFEGFEMHHGDAEYWKEIEGYDHYTEGPHSWSDEMLIAATHLLDITGDDKYLNWIQSELPPDMAGVRRWGWDMEGPWLNAYLSLWNAKDARLDPAIKQQAADVIKEWTLDTMNHDRPFGTPMIGDVRYSVGWYFTGSMSTYPLMLAYGITEDEMFREQIILNWNYLLGTNPLSRTFISGLGHAQRSPRWFVLEIGHYQWSQYIQGFSDGWCEVPPGIPSADIQDGVFPYYYNDTWNQARKDLKFPQPGENYPPLYRYSDCWNTTDEFTISTIARQAASLIPLLPSNQDPPSSINLGEYNRLWP